MFLGIDLGTSEVKLLLLNGAGQIIAQAGSPLTVARPQPLWAEQQPQDWWAARQAVRWAQRAWLGWQTVPVQPRSAASRKSPRYQSDLPRHHRLQQRLQLYRDLYQRLKSLPSPASLA